MPKAERQPRTLRPKRLVVDASVLRAAGSAESVHPVGARCRDTLIVIRDGPHHIAITDEIVEEWNRHASGFARAWRVAMHARRKTIKVPPTDCADVITILRNSKNFSAPQTAVVEKDMHLVAAARSADKTILSLDERTRVLLRALVAETRALDGVLWANPADEFDLLRGWLAEGGKAALQWRLNPASADPKG